jgi:Tfp pilus assembly protein PilP
MKLRTTLFVLTLAGCAAAQTGIAPINAAQRAAKASSQKTAETNKALPPQTQPAAKPAAAKTDPFASKPAAHALVTANAPKPVATAAKPEAPKVQPEQQKKPVLAAGNKRDPFVSIIRSDKTGGANPCLSGKKCLVIGEIVLRGIVKSPNAIIAVVENGQKKTYFLHENDPVFNGEVVKITSDSIVFRELKTDRVGKVTSKEIIKQLNTRPIA